MRHVPVLLKGTLIALQLRPGMNVIDCTLGDAGHSEAILDETGPTGMLLGLDADIESILRAKRYLYRFENRAILVKSNFEYLKKVVDENKFKPVNAILMDLGWSSPQFEERGRGFSFQKDEPLDMRYDENQKSKIKNQNEEESINILETASDYVNNLDRVELAKIFKNYGEEKFYKEISAEIVEKRKVKKIETTLELVNIVLEFYRKKFKTDKEIPWIGGIHPATKIFQALRIAVNRELEILKTALPEALEILAPGGRLAVITFHSLEDRIVKQYFQKINNKIGKIVNKKPIIAGEEEITNNPRARSAKLRIIERI